jgi:uncharacterized protein YyaL (SSP411 family)
VCQLLLARHAGADSGSLSNQLQQHPAPYLAMHGNDPVQWQLWGAEALQKAQRLNRPLFISIGYFACHWCHVMQRESYQDKAIAALLNQFFIPVKVDRELNPALDAHLIEFVELTRGQAGWPLNVFLTPDGYPMLGMTYVPPERFNLLLQQLHRRWDEDEPELRSAARAAMQEWRKLGERSEQHQIFSGVIAEKMLVQTEQLKDELSGGFGQQNKFPMAPQLRALVFLGQRGSKGVPDEFIHLTLDNMASQGLHDNLGGGFFRYTTNPDWRTPHYEKMLYDNAQLAVLYMKAAKLYSDERYRNIGIGTVDFIIRDMSHADGGFISSFSAVDDLGREGFYYLWSQQQLTELLDGEELKAVQAALFDGHAPETEFGQLPRWQGDTEDIAKRLQWRQDKLDKALAGARKKMLAARANRTLPADDKVLAAWNGLALSAIAEAYGLTGDAVYAHRAQRLADYLVNTLWDGRQLLRTRQSDKLVAEASLEDYALVAQGLWDWSQQQPEGWKSLQSKVAQLVRIAWQRYYSAGHWRNSDTPLIPMLEGSLAMRDSPLPSATAAISRISGEHPTLQADKTIQKQLQQHLQAVHARLGDSIFWYASYVELLADNQR